MKLTISREGRKDREPTVEGRVVGELRASGRNHYYFLRPKPSLLIFLGDPNHLGPEASMYPDVEVTRSWGYHGHMSLKISSPKSQEGILFCNSMGHIFESIDIESRVIGSRR